MLRLRYAGIAVVAALGCSPVKDSSNVPDAPIDSMDTRPPMIESSSPANMATKVSVLSNISVFFDEQLDPATVSASTVKLGYNQTIPTALFPPPFDILRSHGGIPAGLTVVKGTVSYEPAGRKVSFVPAAPLPYGYVFVLSFDVKDKGGVAFTGNLTFTTYVNGQTKQHLYNTAGAPTSSVLTPVDMNGRPAKRLGTNAPGTDTIWFTPDDPKNQHYDYTYAIDGRLQDERQYGPGGDGLYDTADDTTSICVRYAYNADKQTTERTYASGPGTDGMWCTADDAVVVNTVYTYMGTTMTGWIYNTNPGTDALWHTTDDKCSYWWEYAYDGMGQKTREIIRSCGADGFSKTADDTFYYYIDYEYDAGGNPTKLVYYSGAGSDTIWLNGDDAKFYVDRWIRDADGQVTEYYRSNGAGPDMVWGNGDDPGTRTVNTYNARGLLDDSTLYNGIGMDNMWGTTDDVVAQYMKTTYDTLGNRIDQKTYLSGADGVWKNADDRVLLDSDFDLTH